MSDTTKSAVMKWSAPPPRSNFDPEVLQATLMELQERAADEKIPDDEKYGIIKEGVSSGWTNSNKLAQGLKEKGVTFRTHKGDDGKFTVYAKFNPPAPTEAEASKSAGRKAA